MDPGVLEISAPTGGCKWISAVPLGFRTEGWGGGGGGSRGGPCFDPYRLLGRSGAPIRHFIGGPESVKILGVKGIMGVSDKTSQCGDNFRMG